MIRVAVIGATGYTALELIKILLRHPEVEITTLTSRSEGSPHVASVHPQDLQNLGVAPGAAITVASRRGSVSLYARADDGTPRGAVFIPFCYYEAAANLLTNPALDPFGKIPEFKYCAVRVTAGGTVEPQQGYHQSTESVPT